jgi:hypothetical protein
MKTRRKLSTKSKKRFARQIRSYLENRLHYRKHIVKKTTVDYYSREAETKEPAQIVINFPEMIDDRTIRKAIRHTSMGKKIIGRSTGTGTMPALFIWSRLSMIRDISFNVKSGWAI